VESTTLNAIIKSTQLGFEDHGILTIWINLEFDSGGQGFGGFALDDKPLEQDRMKEGYRRQPSTLAGLSITGLLKTLGIEKWEKLAGTYVRVRKPEGHFGPITHIGHIIKDRWFSFVEATEANKDARVALIDSLPRTIKTFIDLPPEARKMLDRIAHASKSHRYLNEADRNIAADLLALYPAKAGEIVRAAAEMAKEG
jgi:hypothetical protein